MRRILRQREDLVRPLVVLGMVGIIITVTALLALLALRAHGPYWLGHNLDPDYPYLLNSLNVATLNVPGHYDHPGTPVQLIGGAVVRVAYLVSGQEVSIDESVIGKPESYLRAIQAVIVMLVFLVFCLMVLRVYLVTRSASATVFAASAFFVSPLLFQALSQVRPEPLLVMAALLMQMVLAQTFKTVLDRRRTAIALAAIVGFGVAAKVTFLPFALVPLIVLYGWRNRWLYTFSSMGFFVLFTLPILTHYRAVARWFLNMLTHTGKYGYGDSGIIDVPDFVSTLLRLLVAEPILAVSIVLSFVYVAVILSHREKRSKETLFRTIVALTASLILQLFMVAKHPEPHYMVPSLAFAAFLIACIVVHAAGNSVRHRSLITLGTLVMFALLGSGVFRFNGFVGESANRRSDASALAGIARWAGKGTPVCYYRASSLPFALWWADNNYAGSRHAARLAQLYGTRYFYDPWMGSYYNFESKVPRSLIADASDGVISFQGLSFETGELPGGLKPAGIVEKIVQSHGEAVYRAVGDAK